MIACEYSRPAGAAGDPRNELIPGEPGINSGGVTGKPLGVRQPVYVVFLDGRGEPLPPGASRLSGRTRRAEISLAVARTPDGESRLCPEGKERGDGERQDGEPIPHVSLPHVDVMSGEWNRPISSLSKAIQETERSRAVSGLSTTASENLVSLRAKCG